MRGDQKLGASLSRLLLEVIEDLPLQVHVQVGIRLVEQDRSRLVPVQKRQQGQRLVESAPSRYDVVVLAVLLVLDGDADILGRIVSRLVNFDRKPAFDDARQFFPVRGR